MPEDLNQEYYEGKEKELLELLELLIDNLSIKILNLVSSFVDELKVMKNESVGFNMLMNCLSSSFGVSSGIILLNSEAYEIEQFISSFKDALNQVVSLKK